MQIGEQYCGCDGECYYRNSDCFGKIYSLIEAFSQFDIVELSNIDHGSYITNRSVLNSNRLRVSVGFELHYDLSPDFMSQCRMWLNYKAPNWSQPPRELYLDEMLDFPDGRALLRGLISVGFSYNYKYSYHTWFLLLFIIR